MWTYYHIRLTNLSGMTEWIARCSLDLLVAASGHLDSNGGVLSCHWAVVDASTRTGLTVSPRSWVDMALLGSINSGRVPGIHLPNQRVSHGAIHHERSSTLLMPAAPPMP